MSRPLTGDDLLRLNAFEHIVANTDVPCPHEPERVRISDSLAVVIETAGPQRHGECWVASLTDGVHTIPLPGAWVSKAEAQDAAEPVIAKLRLMERSCI